MLAVPAISTFHTVLQPSSPSISMTLSLWKTETLHPSTLTHYSPTSSGNWLSTFCLNVFTLRTSCNWNPALVPFVTSLFYLAYVPKGYLYHTTYVRIFFLCVVVVYVCIHPPVYLCVWMCGSLCGGLQSILGVSLFFYLVFWGLSLNMELTDLTRLAGWWTTGVLLPLPPQEWNNRNTLPCLAFYMVAQL